MAAGHAVAVGLWATHRHASRAHAPAALTEEAALTGRLPCRKFAPPSLRPPILGLAGLGRPRVVLVGAPPAWPFTQADLHNRKANGGAVHGGLAGGALT